MKINWSYRYRGKKPLIKTTKIVYKAVLRVNQKENERSKKELIGHRLLPLPKNKILNSTPKRIILPYSAKKNKAKAIPEYSVLYPATSSASASVKSKGVLLDSAKLIIKNIIDRGKKDQKNKTSFCDI